MVKFYGEFEEIAVVVRGKFQGRSKLLAKKNEFHLSSSNVPSVFIRRSNKLSFEIDGNSEKVWANSRSSSRNFRRSSKELLRKLKRAFQYVCRDSRRSSMEHLRKIRVIFAECWVYFQGISRKLPVKTGVVPRKNKFHCLSSEVPWVSKKINGTSG